MVSTRHRHKTGFRDSRSYFTAKLDWVSGIITKMKDKGGSLHLRE
jgi:hypothetical protein